MSDDYLKEYKPKDAPCHYQECLRCGKGPDLSFFMSEFGLCLKCWRKLRRKIPKNLDIPLGRILLWNKEKHTE
jgi:hypothetical protein